MGELEKFSTVGILLSHSFTKVIRLILTAHHTTLMVPPSHGLQSVENQSHSDLILTSILRLLNATESQNSLSRLLNQLQPPCNQADACIFIPLPLKRRVLHWLSLVRMRIESMPQDSITSQLYHATLMSG